MLAIPAGAESKSPLTLWLGGHHGEEEKSEGGEEEDCEAEEEEVGSRHFTVFDVTLMSMIASTRAG